jgi:NAD(P)-dependent dehydrogenase (short-subunit alcohol dehydrogenase family)
MSVRNVLITGCSTGIGRACAVRLAQEGFNVIASVRNEADETSIRADADAGAFRIIRLDVTDAQSIGQAREQMMEIVGDEGLYGLVNNAGICVVGPVECVSMENWREQFEVNLFGTVAVINAMLPLLRKYPRNAAQDNARIININSVCGEIATPVFAAYSASKFALRAMSDCLRLELRSQGIRVCSIMPGTIQSEIWRKEKEGIQAICGQPVACEVYPKLIKNVSDYVFLCADSAIPADRVAYAVQRALQSRKPKDRYNVGWEAHIGAWTRRYFPERLFQFLLGRTLGVPACEE